MCIRDRGSQGTAPYQYQYSVNGEVVRSYSTDRQYTWTPDEAGEYTCLLYTS